MLQYIADYIYFTYICNQKRDFILWFNSTITIFFTFW